MTPRRMTWTAGRVPADYVLGGVRAVLPGAVVDDARVVVRDGLIAEAGPAPAGAAAGLDGRGLLCVPGLIDVHSDALERERAPRPGVHLPWDFAVTSLEARLSAAGITTAFHGAGFQDELSGATPRSVRTAVETCEAVSARALAPAPRPRPGLTGSRRGAAGARRVGGRVPDYRGRGAGGPRARVPRGDGRAERGAR